ncbi:hypothetical protein [Paraburkholderia terrae]|uniref:hypothetical protein n=1 Tax=Paraburkholderia terrae TaxID=311230 RepID=UPI0012DFFB29|nr:hypothetical protein [Paraburkholderia terrae]
MLIIQKDPGDQSKDCIQVGGISLPALLAGQLQRLSAAPFGVACGAHKASLASHLNGADSACGQGRHENR